MTQQGTERNQRDAVPPGAAPVAPRTAHLRRSTHECTVELELNLDGSGDSQISTGVRFYDHMLASLAKHALIDLRVEATGDVDVDAHHTVEDVAIVLGAAFGEALGNRAGIVRFGDARVPMDEALGFAAVDVGGRSCAVVDLPFHGERVGSMAVSLFEHVLDSFCRAAGITAHVSGTGRDDHHLAEAAFKSLGRALRAACERDPRRPGIASTKGSLG